MCRFERDSDSDPGGSDVAYRHEGGGDLICVYDGQLWWEWRSESGGTGGFSPSVVNAPKLVVKTVRTVRWSEKCSRR